MQLFVEALTGGYLVDECSIKNQVFVNCGYLYYK